MIKEYSHSFKMVLIGDAGVGKSSILLRYTDDIFVENYMATLGVDFRFKNITIDDKVIKLQIWDTAGQERFRTVTNVYFKNSNAIIIVYDMTSKESFQNVVDYWFHELQNHSDKNTFIALIGNKFDMKTDIDVDFKTVQEFADKHSIKHYQIKETFLDISSHLIHLDNQKVEHELTTGLSKNKKKAFNANCC